MTTTREAVVIVSIVVCAVIWSLLLIPNHTKSTCNVKEYETVAAIANATGRLPGDPIDHSGVKYSVNPNACK